MQFQNRDIRMAASQEGTQRSQLEQKNGANSMLTSQHETLLSQYKKCT